MNIKIVLYKNSIIILLLQLCYNPNYIKKLLPDAPGIKNLDGMIIMFQGKKAERLPVFSMELKCFLQKQLQTKTCLLPHYPESS